MITTTQHKIELRNNWTDWTVIPHLQFNCNASNDSIASEASFHLELKASYFDASDNTNLIRQFTEIRVDETINNVTKCRFHGLIDSIDFKDALVIIGCLDPIGFWEKYFGDLGLFQADSIKIGSAASPVDMVLEPGSVKKYIPNYGNPTYNDCFTGGAPVGPGYTNRRVWKSFGKVIDDGVQDTNPNDPYYYPDLVIPKGLYNIGTDTLNYLEFIGHIPQGNITIDFISVYIEGTNQLEDILEANSNTPFPSGPEWENGYQYETSGNPDSSDYYTKTWWESLLTLNRHEWKEEDGTWMQMLESMKKNYAAINLNLWWDSILKMARLQYVEQTPHSVLTSYYSEKSYAFGRITSIPPDATTDDFINLINFKTRSLGRDDTHFASEIIVEGTNKYPTNLAKATHDIAPSNFVALLSEWPAGGAPTTWTESGKIADLFDGDAGSEHKIWNETDNWNPTEDVTNSFHPTYYCDLGQEEIIEKIRFFGCNSFQAFKWHVRFEICNDSPGVYDSNASWEPMHEDLYDRMFGAFDEVKVTSDWSQNRGRYILISFKPAKIHSRHTWSGGFSELRIEGRQKVIGKARIVNVGSVVGEWKQYLGVGDADGYATLYVPQLHNQLFDRSTFANKTCAGHRIKKFINLSLIDTNKCALEAARILFETVRDVHEYRVSGTLINDLRLYNTGLIKDPFYVDQFKKALITNLTVNDGKFDLNAKHYSAQTWTKENIGDLNTIIIV